MNNQRYRSVFVGNFNLIKKSIVEETIGKKFDQKTWHDCCQYLEDNIKIELEDILVKSLEKYCTINEYEVDYEENNLPKPTCSLCTLSAYDKIYREIVYERVKKPRIPKVVFEQFIVIFEYLVIKFSTQYVSMIVQ